MVIYKFIKNGRLRVITTRTLDEALKVAAKHYNSMIIPHEILYEHYKFNNSEILGILSDRKMI